MTRQSIIEYVGDWFNAEREEDGSYDTNSYDFEAGCYHDGKWLNLNEIIALIEHIAEEEGF